MDVFERSNGHNPGEAFEGPVTATLAAPDVEYSSPIAAWAPEVGTPFRPVHEILELAEVGLGPEPLLEEETPWSGSAEQVTFREAVLRAHLERSRARKGTPGRDLADRELGPVAGTGIRMRTDAAAAAGRLIAAANEALARAQQAGDADARLTTRVGATSGYRDSAVQARLWRRYFPDYYRRTARERAALPSGPHGNEAVRYMIDTFRVPRWIAAPGYSNHQSGIAIDLRQERSGGSEIRNSSQAAHLTRWRASWLFRWLGSNAASFGFQPYRREPWHWEYRSQSTGETEARMDQLAVPEWATEAGEEGFEEGFGPGEDEDPELEGPSAELEDLETPGLEGWGESIGIEGIDTLEDSESTHDEAAPGGYLAEDETESPPLVRQAPARVRGSGSAVRLTRQGNAAVIERSSLRLETEDELEGGAAPLGLEEFEIFPPDERRLVTDTTTVPFRFICNLDLVFPNPGNPQTLIHARGSGTLISPRHVLTAAHNVFDDLRRFGITGGAVRADHIFAAPGRNGRRFPFGRSPAVEMRVPTQWQPARNAEFDFALLTLSHNLGAAKPRSLGGQQLGFWGHPRLGGGTRIRPLEDRIFEQNPRINLSGYPSDKCRNRPAGRAATAAELAACTGNAGSPILTDRGSTQWRAFGRITHPSPIGMPRTVGYDLDSATGHSGCPVWLRWENARNLVAVNTGGLPRDTTPFDIIASMGTRITEDLLTQLRTWMRADGVSPTF